MNHAFGAAARPTVAALWGEPTVHCTLLPPRTIGTSSGFYDALTTLGYIDYLLSVDNLDFLGLLC
jgi:hypothetical protein